MEDKVINQIIGNFFPPTWREILFACALAAASICISFRKKEWGTLRQIIFPFLTLYICCVLGITLLYRLPFDSAHYNYELFWSYKGAKYSETLLREIVLNYLLLLPYGAILPLYWKRRWTVLSGALFSFAIELAQFFMRRGLFEFDDIIGNTVGVILGVGLFSLLKRLKRAK